MTPEEHAAKEKLATIAVERLRIFGAIDAERRRQGRLKAEGKFDFTAADASHLAASAILTEEVGEAAREALALEGIVRETGDVARLRKELIQVAAVAVAWVEKIDAERDRGE